MWCEGFTPASILDDSPMTYFAAGAPPYSPVNYDGKFHGKVPLRLALGNSFNIPAVKLLQQVGIPTMVDLAKEMGISSWGDPSEYGLSLTLGSAETTMIDMATVFGTLANEGLRVDIDPIQKITQSDKDLVEEKREIKKTRVFESSIAYLMSHMLSDNAARAGAFTKLHYYSGHTVSVKRTTTIKITVMCRTLWL
jgi:membrane peptidoglycan carboxypeptidase